MHLDIGMDELEKPLRITSLDGAEDIAHHLDVLRAPHDSLLLRVLARLSR
jgi:hypothetical protein